MMMLLEYVIKSVYILSLKDNYYIFIYLQIHPIKHNNNHHYIIFVVVVVILLPNTKQTTLTSSIANPSPHLSRTRSFTMINYATITDWSFRFADHLHCRSFGNTLNNTYSEPLEIPVINGIFIDANKTTGANNMITVIRTAIIK